MLHDIVREIKEFSDRNGLWDKKILLMFSGGKDSSLALYLLKEAGLDVSALTFFHQWSWKEPLSWAMEFANGLKVEHYLVDITEGLLREAVGKKGPICIHCKKVMMRNAYWFAKINGFDILAKGDNANDKIIGALLDQWKGDIRLSEIPRIGIPIFRPLITYRAEIIGLLTEEAGIKPYRMYEYGRRKQWREGCPLQYIDRESITTPELMNIVYSLNYEISQIARKYKVRLSVRVPSFEIMCNGCTPKILKEVEKIVSAHRKAKK
ncbi:7-cyano-7-deazaguanine synthase [Thermococcus sp.]